DVRRRAPLARARGAGRRPRRGRARGDDRAAPVLPGGEGRQLMAVRSASLEAAHAAVHRRHVRVRGGHLGPFLCWAVVFADIGTSIYYVPGILYGHFQGRSAIFVGMTLIVFILLTVKYS